MMKKITILFMGIIFIFSACEEKDSMESLYRNAEKMEGDILKSATTIAQYRANYEKILLEAPESEFAPLACYKLAKLNEIFGHYQDAINYYQKLLVQFPEHRICAEGLFNMAQIYQLHLNKNDDAITAFTQLVHFYPEGKATFQGLLQLGQLLSEKEKWEDAVYYFQTIVEKYPDQPICDDLYFRMGDILQHKVKDQTKAIEMYRMVVEKYPNSSFVKFAQQRLEALQQGS
ncbi:MAG TPA: tetratricopeptide repeat protein [bacterium]